MQLAPPRRLDGAGVPLDVLARARIGDAGAGHRRHLRDRDRRRADLGAQARRRLSGREDAEADGAGPGRSGARSRTRRPRAWAIGEGEGCGGDAGLTVCIPPLDGEGSEAWRAKVSLAELGGVSPTTRAW